MLAFKRRKGRARLPVLLPANRPVRGPLTPPTAVGAGRGGSGIYPLTRPVTGRLSRGGGSNCPFSGGANSRHAFAVRGKRRLSRVLSVRIAVRRGCGRSGSMAARTGLRSDPAERRLLGCGLPPRVSLIRQAVLLAARARWCGGSAPPVSSHSRPIFPRCREGHLTRGTSIQRPMRGTRSGLAVNYAVSTWGCPPFISWWQPSNAKRQNWSPSREKLPKISNVRIVHSITLKSVPLQCCCVFISAEYQRKK